MLHYIIQTIGFQLVFLLVYDLFLRKETFFTYNRIYLLATTVLSFILPLIKIERLKTIVPEEFVVRLPEVVIGNVNVINDQALPLDTLVIEPSSFSILSILFFIGSLIALGAFLRKLFRLYWLSKNNTKQKMEGFTVVNLSQSNAAFSFFNLVFLGNQLSGQEKATILNHERIHVMHKHSIDVIVFELLRIVFWFNPFIYMYQNRLASLHEFIADAAASTYQDKKTYYENLLKQVFDVSEVSFTNSFFNHSLIKKRIVMLGKTKSKRILKLKYILLVPAICGMLIYSSCSAKKNAVQNNDVVNNSSTLTDKVTAVKQQIMVQGNVSDTEAEGLDLLYKTIEDDKKNKSLIKDVTDYTAAQNQTELSSKISDVLVQIQRQGNVTSQEEQEMKELLVLTTSNGLNDPLFSDVVDRVEVPFGVIDEVPIYETCKELSDNEERKKCMSTNIAKHVNNNFNIDLAKSLGLKGKQRINVIFKIDKQGNVTDIRARAPHPDLEKEAIRVIGTLPQFIPGKHQGKSVIVPYSLPIVFQVNSETIVQAQDKAMPFTQVDAPPVLLSCQNAETIELGKTCTSNEIAKYVNKNFDMKIAQKLKLKGVQRIKTVFKINKYGSVAEVKVRAPHPDLEEETKRVVYSLPKFVPGSHEGKPVDVTYSLPIQFQTVQ